MTQSKSVLMRVLEKIETKNSWGKNELKDLLLRELVKEVEPPSPEPTKPNPIPGGPLSSAW